MENYSRTVYSLIAEENYIEVVRILENELHSYPDSTAIYSLLGYCYWQQEDYQKACACYAKLVQLNPRNLNYKLHHAHCLYKTSQYYEAVTETFGCAEQPNLKPKVNLLQAAIRYAEGDIQSVKSILTQSDQESEDIMLDQAVVLYKEDQFEEALEKYMEVKRIHGFKPEIVYCIALCYYRLNRFSDALSYIAEVKENCTRTHPEFLRSLTGEPVDLNVAGSVQMLQELYLVETFNLLMAIEFDQKHVAEAKEALDELPTRPEEDLDHVTLHNKALVVMDENPSEAFSKLVWLLQTDAPLPETFRNLLLGYCKFEYYSEASDLLAENTDLAMKTMGKPTMDFLEAVLLCQTSKEEAFRKFDELCTVRADILRRIMQQIGDARKTQDDELQKQLTIEFEANIGELIPILMFQAKIFWDLENYEVVEGLLTKFSEMCIENRTWKLNLAHTYFMQPKTKMHMAIPLYEGLIYEERSLLDVEAILVANLCVAYVMSDQNASADELIGRLMQEEEEKEKENPDAKLYHLSIIHLVIGTLYCTHKNFEFGIDYVFKAFNPMHTKLSATTWLYAKRCLLEVIRCMSFRQYLMLDSTFDKICTFLDQVDKNGKQIESIIDMNLNVEQASEHQTISFEARTIKAMLCRLFEF